MSLSNPTINAPSPCTRFFEWDGEKGEIRYYDKELVVKGREKKGGNVVVDGKFTFIVLDELSTVRGWFEKDECGIYSNEVRDTRQETMVVKSFKGTLIASGFYADIKDRVNAQGGNYTTNIYIAFKDGKELKLAALQLKGAALNAWVDFRKPHRSDLLKKAVVINGCKEGKKGKIVFQTPIFGLKDISDETITAAIEIDKSLQAYLTGYFANRKTDQVARPPAAHSEEPPVEHRDNQENQEHPPEEPQDAPPPDDDDVPF